MLLLTLVRKTELTGATLSEIHFEHAVWTIPGPRMKRRNPHNVYLCRQVMDILVAFKTCAGGSRYIWRDYQGRNPLQIGCHCIC